MIAKTREEAIENGVNKYVSNRPCIKCGSDIRYVRKNKCVKCMYNLNHSDKGREANRIGCKKYRDRPENIQRQKDRISKYMSNPEYVLYISNRNKEYRNSPEIKEKLKQYRRSERVRLKQREQNNRAEIRERQRELSREYKRNYKDRVTEQSRYRQALKKQRVPAWANRNLILEKYTEAKRLTEETGIPHHVDHIIPLQGKMVSGLHVETNLRVITAEENLRKHNSLIEELV